PVEEVAEVAADVAGLAEPEDATPGEELLARLEVAGRYRMARRARVAVGVRGVLAVHPHAGAMPLHGHLPRVLRIPRHCDALLIYFRGRRNAWNAQGESRDAIAARMPAAKLPGMRAFATHVGCCGNCVSWRGTGASCASWSRVT